MRTYTEETITPDMAREYLARNVKNRALKPRRIREYTASMRAGMWPLNGEGIKFDTNGNLLDGQNRLHAIIAADVPITMLVVRGLATVTQESMDGGASRSLVDALKLRDESNCTAMSSVIRALFFWDTRPDTSRVLLGPSGQGDASNGTLLAYFDANADTIRNLTLECDRWRKSRRLQTPNSVTAPLIRAMMDADVEDFLAFSEHLRNGSPAFDASEDDPVLRLLNALAVRREDNSWHNPTEMGALIVKSWNAYRAGVPIKTLRWRMGGAHPETFPEVK